MFLRFSSKFLQNTLAAAAGVGLLLTGVVGGRALAQAQAPVPASYSRDEIFACMLYIEVWRKKLPEDRQSFPVKASNWWHEAYNARGGPSYRLYEEDLLERVTDNAIKAGFQTCMRIYQGDQTASLAGPMDVIRQAVAMGPPLVDQRAAAKRQEEDRAAQARAERDLVTNCENLAVRGLDGALSDMKEANRMMATWNATQRYGTNYAWEPFERGCRRLGSTLRSMHNMGCPASVSDYVQDILNQYALHFDNGPEYCKQLWL